MATQTILVAAQTTTIHVQWHKHQQLLQQQPHIWRDGSRIYQESSLPKSQVSLLAQRPNFLVAPPYGEYIAAGEQACINLEPHDAEELRAEIRGVMKHSYPSRENITKEEAQVLAELRRHQSRVILIDDKP